MGVPRAAPRLGRIGLMATRPLRWGVLGAGLIAGLFVADLRTAGLTVAAVGSRTLPSAAAFAAEHALSRVHASYAALCEDPDVDIVYVATPNVLHRENALQAIAAGKHVLVEKPFAMDRTQAREIVDAARATGVVVMEAMWTRFLPHMARVRELVRTGSLGDVRTVTADHDQRLSADPTHRINDLALGGGALLDLGVYPISFAVDLLGLPTSVQAHATMTSTGVDQQTSVLMGHAGGRQSVSHSAIDTPGPVRAAVLGTDARIELAPWWYNATGFIVRDAEDRVLETFSRPVVGRGMQYEAIELERVIREGLPESPLMPAEESIAIMGVLDAVRSQIGLVFP